MKTRIAVAGSAVAALVLSLFVFVSNAQAVPGGFNISGRNLVDGNGNVFIMRGTSHPHVWFQGETNSFSELAGLGSNAVRVVLGSGQRNWGINSAADVANVVSLCKQNRLICMLEVHDTTGFGEQGGAATLDQAVTYWDSIRSALIGQEAFILINIGNEPIGNNNPAQWTTATVNAVQRMRTLGFGHTLVVDAPNWGQDWTNTMRSNAQTVWNADSQRNTLFSIHMYEVYPNLSAITTYFDAFASMGLPLVVGEFGNMHNGQNVDEDSIMSEAQARGIGWLAWSYSGNSDGLLDQATAFNPAQLTTWGQRVFNGPNGVAATARCATVYTGCGPANPPPAPTGLTVTGTTSSSVSLSWTASTGATQYQIQRANGACSTSSSFAQIATSTTTTFTNSSLPSSTSFCYRVTASNANGTSGPSNTVTGTTGGGTTPPPAPTGLTVTGTTSSSVSLSWTASTGATQYQIQRANGACSTSSSFAQVGTSTSTTFTNTGLAASTTFCYRVTASNANGTSGPSNTVPATTGGANPPPAPTGLTVTGTTSSSVSLSWTASTGATQYQIQRANGACSTSSSFAQVGTSTSTTFTNTGLAASTTFCYRVTASNANGTSGPSNTVPATTGGGTSGGCSAVPTVQSAWGNGYVVQPVTVTNTGTSAITGWRVTFTLPAGHAITGSWNATLSGTTGTVTATNMSYNGNLGPGANTSFGFQVSRPDGNTQVASGYTCAPV